MKKTLFAIAATLSLSCLFSCSHPEETPTYGKLIGITLNDDRVKTYEYDGVFVPPIVTANYNNNTSRVVSTAVFEYNLKVAGKGFVNVTYTENYNDGKDIIPITARTYYDIFVKEAPTPAATLSSIAVTGNKITTYTQGDTFVDPIVTAYYSDSSYRTVTATFTGYNLNNTGNQTVNVSYTESNVTKTTSYQINVVAKETPKTLQSIITNGTVKTTYTVGDNFVKPTIIAEYSNGTVAEVDATFTGYNMSTTGEQTVNVSYTEDGVTKGLTYTINVNAKTESLDVKDINPALVSSQDYLDFFNHSTNLSINISMSRAAAEFMNNYQTSNDSTFHDYYVPCDFTFTMKGSTTTYKDVGIRVKGNMSRQRFLNNGSFSSTNLSHFKFKFCETFDGEEYDTIEQLKPFKKTYETKEQKKEFKNRTLFGMEKLNIKWNRNEDVTRSKQGYILDLFENNGVLTAKSTLSPVSLGIVNTNFVNSVYEVFEDIDDIFISRHFAEEYAAGDLYKCTYQNRGPADFNKDYTVGNQIGVEDNPTNYHPSYDLKTNKKKSDHSALTSLITLLNQDTWTSEKWQNEISKRMDMNSFLMYEAIAFLGGNFDDLRNNANNYYLYFVSSTNYCYVIPYDFDRCFGCGTNGYKDFMTNFSADTTKMQCSGNMQTMSLYWRTVCREVSGHPSRVSDYYSQYCRNIEMLLNNNNISYNSFSTFVNKYPSSYRGTTTEFDGNNLSFSTYLSKKIKAIKDNNKDIHIN